MFERLTDHIYVRPCEAYTDRPNIGLIIGEKYTLLYDAGNSETNVIQLKEELQVQGLPLPNILAISHWHWDHTFGMHAWGVPVIAGKLTNEQLKRVSAWAWDDEALEERLKNKEDIAFCHEMVKREYPDRKQIYVTTADIVFEGKMSIDLGGGVSCELIHAKGPHAEDSVICYVPSDKFVFLGDSNGKDLYENPWDFDLEREESIMEAIIAIPYDKERVNKYKEVLNELDFTMCIGGHAGVMTKEELYESLSVG